MTTLIPTSVLLPAAAAATLLLARAVLARLGRPPPCTVPYAVVAGWLVAAGGQRVALLGWPPEPLAAIGLGGLVAAFGAAAVRSAGGRAERVGPPLLAALPPLLGAASLLPASSRAFVEAVPAALLAGLLGAAATALLRWQSPRLPERARPLPSALWLAAVAAAGFAHGSLSLGAVFAGAASAAAVVVLATALRHAPPSAFPTVAGALGAGSLWAAWRLAALPAWLVVALPIPLALGALSLRALGGRSAPVRLLAALLGPLLALGLVVGAGLLPPPSGPAADYGYGYDPGLP